MLAMPATNAFAGFLPAFFSLSFCWLFMLATAWIFLDVHLYVGKKTNLISMSKALLGKKASIFCWIFYLLLLYSLNAAYISGASSLLVYVLEKIFDKTLPFFPISLMLCLFFASFLYFGTRSVDLMNRVFMFALVISYGSLLLFLPDHVQKELFFHKDWGAIFPGIPVLITAFGFHIVIPTLSAYMNYRKKPLKTAIFWGSFFAFVVYALWEALTLSVIPLVGEKSFYSALEEGGSITSTLAEIAGSPSVQIGALLFSFFAILTSFLGVSLSLSDFIQDGLKMRKTTKSKKISLIATFLPPLFFVAFYQKGFLLALEYAAFFVLILLAIYPILMAWKMPRSSFYSSPIGRVYLIVLFLISCFILGISLLQETGYFQYVLNRYHHEKISTPS